MSTICVTPPYVPSQLPLYFVGVLGIVVEKYLSCAYEAFVQMCVSKQKSSEILTGRRWSGKHGRQYISAYCCTYRNFRYDTQHYELQDGICLTDRCAERLTVHSIVPWCLLLEAYLLELLRWPNELNDLKSYSIVTCTYVILNRNNAHRPGTTTVIL